MRIEGRTAHAPEDCIFPGIQSKVIEHDGYRLQPLSRLLCSDEPRELFIKPAHGNKR
jgi:hypothetical protein